MSKYSKGIFKHYFRIMFDVGEWDSDNSTEIDNAVDSLVEEAVKQAVKQVEEKYEARIAALEAHLKRLDDYFEAQEAQS